MAKSLKDLAAFFGMNATETRLNLPTLREIQGDDSYGDVTSAAIVADPATPTVLDDQPVVTPVVPLPVLA